MIIRERQERCRQGFSLVEMLVVVGIIVVMGSILSFGYWNILNREELSGSAETVLSMIGSTRQSAIAKQESRWLEINLAGDSLRVYKKVYVYDRETGYEYEDYEAVTALERTAVDITDITTSTEEPLDMALWEEIVYRQLPIRLEFNPRGALVALYYRSLDTGAWEKTGVRNPVIHLYSLSRSAEDDEFGTEIELSGASLPYRDPYGTQNDVLSNSLWRQRLQVLPSDSLQRRKCYSIQIYGATGRAYLYEYGLGYPWPKSLMPQATS